MKIIDTPFGKAEVIMEETDDGNVRIRMTKKRYEQLTGKIVKKRK